jgi:cobalamin-dependent methionine synthase I
MFIIGAVINTSVEGIDDIIEQRDRPALLELARRQIALGSEMLAVNCGSRLKTEVDDIEWMFRTIQDEIEIPLCIDSPNPEAHRAGLRVHRHGRPMVDAITAEKARIEAIMPLVREYGAMVTALLHDESGMPATAEDRLRVMPVIDAAAKAYGIDRSDIYLDCLVFPISVDQSNARKYLESGRRIKEQYPGYKTICGLNNISYGLPGPDNINTAFLAACAANGQDAAYLEITPVTAAAVKSIRLLEGKDENCMEYITAAREGRFGAIA